MNCLKEVVGQYGEANKGWLQSWSGVNISEQVPLSESHRDILIKIYQDPGYICLLFWVSEQLFSILGLSKTLSSLFWSTSSQISTFLLWFVWNPSVGPIGESRGRGTVTRFPLNFEFWQYFFPECVKLQLNFQFLRLVLHLLREEGWQHLQWEDCQHSIVTAFSGSLQCVRTLCRMFAVVAIPFLATASRQQDNCNIWETTSILSHHHHRWQIYGVGRWWCVWLSMSREASLGMARKFWSELLLAASSPSPPFSC